MKVLMLGWELPPYFAGGVGVVARALIDTLAERGTRVIYLMPRAPQRQADELAQVLGTDEVDEVIEVPAPPRLAPYWQSSTPQAQSILLRGRMPHGALYGPDLIQEVRHFAQAALRTALKHGLRFDVIHAHDWTTFPAALAIGRATGRPVIAHVHITEFDKSGGQHADPEVYQIEREGMQGADRVVAVSHFTARRCREQYGVPAEKLLVVHNAVSGEPEAAAPVASRGPLVLYLGRMTLQKGPDYFLEAARRVLERRPDATFVMAGSGDMLPELIERAAGMGIGRQVLFTGFLKHEEALELYQRASLFVMPSVSEPFGIVPLEALQRGVPVIVSRQSGVSEVLSHALKVDFWDVQRLAAQILAALSFPALSRTLVSNGQQDLKKLSWERAAEHFLSIYHELVH